MKSYVYLKSVGYDAKREQANWINNPVPIERRGLETCNRVKI